MTASLKTRTHLWWYFILWTYLYLFNVSLSFPAPRLQSIALQFTDMSLLAHKSIALKEYSDGKLSRVSVAPFHTKSFLSLYLLSLMARLSGALLWESASPWLQSVSKGKYDYHLSANNGQVIAICLQRMGELVRARFKFIFTTLSSSGDGDGQWCSEQEKVCQCGSGAESRARALRADQGLYTRKRAIVSQRGPE